MRLTGCQASQVKCVLDVKCLPWTPVFEHLIFSCGLASEWDLPGGYESLGWAYLSPISCLSSASDCGHKVTNHLNTPAPMPSAPWWTVSPQTMIPQIPSSLRCQVSDHSTKTSSQDAGPSFPGLVEYSWRLLSNWWGFFSLGKWIFALSSFILLGFLGWLDVPVAEGGMQIKAISTLVTSLSVRTWRGCLRWLGSALCSWLPGNNKHLVLQAMGRDPGLLC